MYKVVVLRCPVSFRTGSTGSCPCKMAGVRRSSSSSESLDPLGLGDSSLDPPGLGDSSDPPGLGDPGIALAIMINDNDERSFFFEACGESEAKNSVDWYLNKLCKRPS